MDRNVWSGVARFWYNKAVGKNPNVRKLYHHLARSFRKSQSEHYEPFHAHSDWLRVSVSSSLVLWNSLHPKSQIIILREFFRWIWYNRLSDQKNFIWQIYRKIHDQIQKIRRVRDNCIHRGIFWNTVFGQNRTLRNQSFTLHLKKLKQILSQPSFSDSEFSNAHRSISSIWFVRICYQQ